MGIKEGALALADELEGVSLKDDCESCLASGTGLCRGDVECAESAHKACAKRLREIVERDECEGTTVSAYDLLSDEDREAIAWVREMGGVNALSRGFQDADNRRIELCSSLGIDLETGWADAMVAMRHRLMPEGMEWPTVDGKPVNFVTGYEPSLGALEAVSIYSNGACEVMGHDGIIKDVKEIHVATPKALDADGVEICVGDRLYDTDTGCGRTVRAVNDNGTVEFDGHENRGWFGLFLTHRAPVLAADGEPLREGEHVYHVETGAELVVKKLPKPGEYQAVVVFAPPASHPTSFDPDQLTHQRPVLDADGVEVHKGDEVWSTTGEFDGKRTVSSVHIDPDEPPYATFEERQKPYSCLCCYLIHRAPVLAADGKPLEAGQTVYATHYGYVKCTVLAIEWVVDGYLVEVENEGGCKFRQTPDCFTHQRPVLDADGEEIRVGDTVWDTETGCGRTVRAVNDNGTVEFDGHENRGWFGKFLTHAKPDLDTWERIEEDATKNPFDYCKDVGHRLDTCENSEAYKARDLVRRARKLAERGE